MQVPTGTTAAADLGALLAAAAARLAADGVPALQPVLDDVVAALHLRGAVLRDVATGELRAVAGDAVHAVPLRRESAAGEPVVSLPVTAAGSRTATLTVVGARPSALPALRGVCAVLGLALRPPDGELAGSLLDAADADADDTADALHDGPVQELVYARFAADAAVRGGDAAAARDAVQMALQSLRRSLWLIRPRGSGDGGLGPALEQLAERLHEAGAPGLSLSLDGEASDALGPRASSVAYRLVQAVAREATATTAVELRRDVDGVHLRVAGRLPAPDRWTARAGAVGASLHVDPAGSVVLSVPASPGTISHDEIEAIP
ncbi:MAG TPA: hypothetical protein VNU26_09990 [Mycobacteriales bacterium]|nr:hypothetical protein [Mycobacteriales bacterium]